MSDELTPLEQKLFKALSDGECHPTKELQLEVVGKRFVSYSLVATHIGRLKRKLPNHTIEHMPKRGYIMKEKSRDNLSR